MQVTKIIDSNINSGMGTKGEWSQSLVELDDGTQTRIFNPIMAGEQVEPFTTEKDGKTYTNYRPQKTSGKGKESAANVAHTLKALKVIYYQNKTILEGLDTISAMLVDLSEKIDSRGSTLVTGTIDEDTVEENPFSEETDPMDEPVNLDGIPF